MGAEDGDGMMGLGGWEGQLGKEKGSLHLCGTDEQGKG